MAKINNQAIMQKLIDELELYPAKDTIPTELAEKLLPVFQVNTQEVEVVSVPDIRYVVDEIVETYDKSIVVPDGKIWQFKNAVAHIDAVDGDSHIDLMIKDSAGEIVFIVHSAPNQGQALRAIFSSLGAIGGTTDTNIPTGTTDDAVYMNVPELYLKEKWSIQIKAVVPIGATFMKTRIVYSEEDARE